MRPMSPNKRADSFSPKPAFHFSVGSFLVPVGCFIKKPHKFDLGSEDLPDTR